MKTIGLTIILLLASIFYAVAQREVVLEPNVNFINAMIIEDVAQNPDTSTVYILRRNSVYYTQGTFNRPNNWALRLKAEEGEGTPPIIQPYCMDDNTIQRDVISSLTGHVVFEGLIFIGEPAGKVAGTDPSYPRTFFAGSSRISSITAKDCMFLGTYQSITRPGAASKVEFRDCLFANLGRVKDGLLGNGRIVDTRGDQVDSLILEHNTTVNSVDKIVRHTGDKPLGYIKINHNTFVNHIGIPFEILSFKELNITNNLFIDPMVMGSDPRDTTLIDAYDGYTGRTWVDAMPVELMVNEGNPSPSVNIGYNVFSHSAAVKDLHQTLGLNLGRFFRDDIETLLTDPSKAFIEKNVNLSNIPEAPVKVVSWWYDPNGADTGNGNLTPPDDVAMDRREGNEYSYWLGNLNCSYPHTDTEMIGSEGIWAGDPHWPNSATGIFTNSGHDMLGVYAYNTLADLVVNFQMNSASDISVRVFDLQGRMVAGRISVAGSEGSNSIAVSKAGMPAGVYIIEVFAQNQVGRIKAFVD